QLHLQEPTKQRDSRWGQRCGPGSACVVLASRTSSSSLLLQRYSSRYRELREVSQNLRRGEEFESRGSASSNATPSKLMRKSRHGAALRLHSLPCIEIGRTRRTPNFPAR